MAFSAVLVGQMPANDTGMLSEFFGQSHIHPAYFISVYRGGIAVVMSAAKQVSVPVRVHPQDLGIFVCHPFWAGTGRSSQDCGDTVFPETVYDIFHPAEMVLPFTGFQNCPGENPQGNFIDFCFLKILDVFFQDIRGIQPLFRIVVPAVNHFTEIYVFAHICPPMGRSVAGRPCS